MGVSPERGRSAATVVRSFDVEPPSSLARDFRISNAHRIGEGSLKVKAHANLTAIRTLKLIEEENRPPTSEEKAVLVKYAGWGALANVFTAYPPREWQAVAAELRDSLTGEEYAAARASTPNAHYTSAEVIQSIWQALQRFGFHAGAHILEPSMGVGHFFGLMPEELYPGTRRTGVEIDSITARIATVLYPDSTVHRKAFEDTILPGNFFDVVIGNIPFGNFPVYDPAYRRVPALTRSIHDYFLAKSLDIVRPGGLLALITSRYTMDKQDSTVRRYLADRSRLLGAVRLPNTTFKANAGTEVTTDILFLQKRSASVPDSEELWRELGSVRVANEPMAINEYFVRHPEMMLGQMALEQGQHGSPTPALTGTFTPELLTNAVSLLPSGVYVSRDRASNAVPAVESDSPALGTVKDGGFADHDGLIVVRKGDCFEPVTFPASVCYRIRGMLTVRDAVREVFRTQLADASEQHIAEARHKLNRAYDRFIGRFGPLNSKENVKAFAGDPDQPLLLSLENYDPEAKRATRTAIFERRTLERYRPVNRVETAAEALVVSLNETGQIHWPRMEGLTGKSARELQCELGALVYQNPEGAVWETADCYLSGNVRAKLVSAESATQIDPAYRRNIEALRAMQPKDLEPSEIEARLGSSWIPVSDIREFLAELLGVPVGQVKVAYAETIATWTVELDYGAKYIVSNTTQHGTARFRASELIEQALNGRTPTAYDEDADGNRVINQQETIAAREKQQQLKDRFREWIWQDSARAQRLAGVYNFQFNNLRLREFDGSHLTLPGMVRLALRDGDLGPHQKNAVWRILQSGSTLLAHVVGAGKTWTMTAAAMELRRLGLAKKPMFVVPNHLVDQWGTEFLRLYPQAQLFIAGKDHFTNGSRQQAMARIATGNYDAVIVSHRSFEFLPISDEFLNRFIDEQVAELDSAIAQAQDSSDDHRRIVKELEKAKKRLAAKLKKRADRESKDRTLTFEELGIDQLFVDEADAYKNLFYVTKMNRIAGLPNSESNRAFDMFLKIRYLRERTGRGVVFATGTPISNTLAEMYTMLRYLAPGLLSERNIEHFDSWAASFAEAVTSLELAPDGSGYRMHTRFAKFINLPELLSIFRTVADVQTADMLNLPRPALANGRPVIGSAPASPALKAFIQTLTERAERLRKEHVDPSVDNMLKITGEGRKAALDMRLVEPTIQPEPDTKINRAVNRILATWQQTQPQRSTQLVFSDLSTPDPTRFNVYHDVRSKLIDAGVPAPEIAFIHDAETDAAKKLLFDGVNAGRVRILLGSTEKMGAGTNVQKRLVALHHLDAPWRPRDIEQREGRILRQGNLNGEVQIYRYVTEGSFDAYMWQTLETKARFIQQVMRGDTSVRAAEDLDSGALTYAEIKAIASGNPAVIEKIKVDTEVRKLDQLRAVHLNRQRHIRWQIHDLPQEIASGRNQLAQIRADIATREAHGNGDFTMTVGNRAFSGKGAREEAAKALTFAVMSWRDDCTMQARGWFRGFEIFSRGKSGGFGLLSEEERVPDLFVRGQGTYSANLNAGNPIGTVQSIEHTLRSLEKLATEEQAHLERIEKTLADYQAQVDQPFEHEERLSYLLMRQAELNAALDLDKGEQQAAEEDMAEPTLPARPDSRQQKSH